MTTNKKRLIITADDFGMCHTFNHAIRELLQHGHITSTTAMMPCPWVQEAVSLVPEAGVHLTFTSEWKGYKWGPIASDVPSLTDQYGYFHRTCADVERQALDEHVRIEVHEQIERAYALGFTPTHIDNHMGSLYGVVGGRDFMEIVLDACATYDLPFRLPRFLSEEYRPELQQLVDRRSAYADQLGVRILDYLVQLHYSLEENETYDVMKSFVMDALRKLKPGVTEMIIHPAWESDEIKGITPAWKKRTYEYAVFQDADVQQVLAEENIELVSWKDVRDEQRQQ